MSAIRSFLLTTILGGVTVILPVAVIFMVFNWVFLKVTLLISPVTDYIMVRFSFAHVVADIIVIGLILSVCFLIGLVERTRLGQFFIDTLDRLLLKKIPGYTVVKETILQLIGKNKSPFSSVALVRIYNNDTLATAFITDEHENGYSTVFVPTGPNPTSGNIFHLKNEYVHKVDFPVESTMRTIISCGAGSQELFKNRGLESN